MREFSGWVNQKRNELLAAMLEWLAKGTGGADYRPCTISGTFDGQEVKRCRFETILWGGDELAFVMPYWLAAGFAEVFFALMRDWAFESDKITHALGVAIATARRRSGNCAPSPKTPPPKNAWFGGKQPLRAANSVTFEIFVNLAPPDDDLEAWRKALYGAGLQFGALPLKRALPGDIFGETITRMRKLIATFPRSQIYAALRKLRENPCGLVDSVADGHVNDATYEYSLRGPRGLSVDERTLTWSGF